MFNSSNNNMDKFLLVKKEGWYYAGNEWLNYECDKGNSIFFMNFPQYLK
jgi:hypothetical protein